MELSCVAVNREIFDALDLDLFDAVYLGQPYCLKTKDNFLLQTEDLKQAIAGIHEKNKQAYVATPIVPVASEFHFTEKIVLAAAEAGADAIEVWDAGAYRYVRRMFPQMPVHVAPMMNIYQPETAAYYRDTGAARLVPANELLDSELQEIVAAVTGVEFAVSVHGALPLGMSYACMLRMDPGSGKLSACRHQCQEMHYLDMGDWRMRCVGTANVTAEDYSAIEYLGQLSTQGYAGYRLETHFDDAQKINALGRIYGEAMRAVGGSSYNPREFKEKVLAISGAVCNGWRFGLPGRMYHGPCDADPFAAASEKARSGRLGGVADAR